jgi:DNA-directed RNA polymerase specialized sigma24 family protein
VSSRPHRCAPALSPVEVYITAVHREIVRLITRGHGADAPLDVAQDVVETLMGKVHEVMANYTSPVTYARVAYRHATIQTGRRNRVQRGEGSRLYMTRDGSRVPGHQVLSGDDSGPLDGRSLFDTLVDSGTPFDESICALIDDRRYLAEVFGRTSADDRAAYFMVRGLGYPVTEVATAFGVRRETLQRRLGQVEATGRAVRSGTR